MTGESHSGVIFIHLHTHSAYSLSEGALPIKQMAKMAREAGMPALAITDSGNLFGALEFSEALSEKGIQPIIGCTLKLDCGDGPQDNIHRQRQAQRRLPSLVLLAKDEAGYRNLMRPGLSRYAGYRRASCRVGISPAAGLGAHLSHRWTFGAHQ